MRFKNIAAVATGLAIVAVIAYWAGSQRAPQADKEQAAGREVAYWVAPMDPNYKRDKPGKSPMGMDLIPVYADEAMADGVVTISPTTQNNIGVRLGSVTRGPLSREIKTVGFIGYDETKLSHVHMRADGWIENLVTKTLGETVQQGDLLFRIYAPQLVVAQSDYVLALNRQEKQYIETASEQLTLLGFRQHQIDGLRQSRKVSQLVDVYAAQGGVITDLNVAENMYVTPATTILTIADLSTVWVMADVFEDQAALLKTGLKARVNLAFDAGTSIHGLVDYVYPVVDPETHTVKVRLKVDNAAGTLKPNMFTDVTIFGEPEADALRVPKDALIRTGASSRVIVALGDGRFEPREVKIGAVTADAIEIKDGLREGEKIVLSGQFLIDSEASLSAGFRRMSETATTSATMDMDDPAPEMGDESMAAEMSMAGEMKEGDPAMAAPVTGTGTVNSVMPAHHMINLTHDPIPAIGWPTMTMDFNVSEEIDLSRFDAGDQVHFELAKGDDGFFFIVALHQTDAMHMEGH
ncbi:MAG: efflux RND transporter periplasmic adaptor subunit [Alphaproteobacteria bacterium]|nr:MAG: efflux RND transporter periplasmic adaptor subunit [Alphaproteobacteria bacterium]